MTALEIILIVIGVIMMIASFFITEKLSNRELNRISELSTEEMKKILERNLKEAQLRVDNMIDDAIERSLEQSMEKVERALDKETNEKIQAISEYSDTVLESIHKTHNEVMFLYSMLNDKHSELTKYAGNLAQLAIHLEELEENVEKTISESGEIIRKVAAINAQKVMEVSQQASVKVQTDMGSSSEEAVLPEIEPESSEAFAAETEEMINHNRMILSMYKDGKSAMEIAKDLGLGVGEVKLVIGLFREEEM